MNTAQVLTLSGSIMLSVNMLLAMATWLFSHSFALASGIPSQTSPAVLRQLEYCPTNTRIILPEQTVGFHGVRLNSDGSGQSDSETTTVLSYLHGLPSSLIFNGSEMTYSSWHDPAVSTLITSLAFDHSPTPLPTAVSSPTSSSPKVKLRASDALVFLLVVIVGVV